ncbi:UPF0260 protein [Psychrosphaera saromensis]|uniref:Uncharacterized protein n=1 Tax=Psychrosphaera saromensis TaxID=716813 RepID=A0A2S7UUN2_9GAMM|nr:YcgN family cysteine cluster protein [Psychrosphaera saromensis]PQJ53653.1 hypothetical protein BTO11_08225 [Psychrosphaera saromensis]GHB63484.1 UPF0260 protein [Psychrosphaera saromensis]GLQ15576.1 UPF0260 protein [Psychrosphaera saromensis]
MEPFWKTKSLQQMSRPEWESLCDGCAKCCLHKLIDDDEQEDMVVTTEMADTEQLHFTSVACQYLNDKKCECSVYLERTKLVPSCVQLTQDNLDQVFYMPSSCSYRRLQEGRGLPSWHPLLNKGKKSKMHQAGMSVRGKVVFDNMIAEELYEDFIVVWPLNDLD